MNESAISIVEKSFSENRPTQDTKEAARLCEHLLDMDGGIGTVLEIGVYYGGTMNLWSKIARPDALLIGVDIKNQINGRRTHVPGQRFEFLEMDSTDPMTKKAVEEILAGRKVDFLFIDGLHTYENCKSDYEMYSPLVRQFGTIAFHDAVGNDHVRKAVAEIAKTSVEHTILFTEKSTDGIMGIAVFKKYEA